MAKTGKRGLRRLLYATGYSAAGLAAAWRSEAAFREEVVAAAVLAPVALWLGRGPLEWLLLLGSLLGVLIVELLNTAVEATVDRIGDDHHALSGRAKDLGSAAVLLSLVLAGATWAAVAWAHFAGGHA